MTAVATYARVPSNNWKSGKFTAVPGTSTVVQLFLVNRFPLVPLLSRIQYPGGSGKGNYLPPSWAVQEELSPEGVDVCGCVDAWIHGFASKREENTGKGEEDSEEGTKKVQAQTKFLEKEREIAIERL